jgi:hypothetical protein
MSEITRIPVSSSNLAEVGYDPETQTLEVQFVSGTEGHYEGVPQAQYDALMAAQSKGSYFHHNIRDRYPWTEH